MLTKFVVTQKFKNAGYRIFEPAINNVSCAINPKMNNNQCNIVVICDNKDNFFMTQNSLDYVKSLVSRTNQFAPNTEIHYLFVILNQWKVGQLVLNNTLQINVNNGRIYHKHIDHSVRKEAEAVKDLLKVQNSLDERQRFRIFKGLTAYRPWISYLVVIGTVLFFFATRQNAMEYGFSPSGVLNGNYASLFTYMLQHGNILHLLGNMTVLLIAGTLLERYIGAAKFICIYIISGLYGSIGTIVMTPSAEIITVGASGAICGVLGALAVKMIFTPEHIRVMKIRSIITTLVITLVSGLVMTSVNNECHIGGLIGGVLFELVFQFADMIELNHRHHKLHCFCRNQQYL